MKGEGGRGGKRERGRGQARVASIPPAAKIEKMVLSAPATRAWGLNMLYGRELVMKYQKRRAVTDLHSLTVTHSLALPHTDSHRLTDTQTTHKLTHTHTHTHTHSTTLEILRDRPNSAVPTSSTHFRGHRVPTARIIL